MLQPKATMSIRKANERVSIIDIRGEVTSAAETVLMDAYTRACADNPRAIILNFAGLEYMNSSGIGLLVTLLIRASRQKQKLLTYGLSDHYRQIFALTRLNDTITVCDSEADAIAAALPEEVRTYAANGMNQNGNYASL